MLKQKLRIARASAILPFSLLVGATLLSGCEGQDAGIAPSPAGSGNQSSPWEVASQALAAYPSGSWSGNNYVVNFCFIDSGFATGKTQIRDAINGSWGANSGLTLKWPANLTTDLCPQSPAGSGTVAAAYLPISLHAGTSGGDWGGACAPGYGSRMSASDCNPGNTVGCQCSFSTADMTGDPARFLGGVAIHEIGHGLGLPHEHQRSDRPSDTSTTCVDPNNEPTRWLNNGNYTIISNLILLTRYDGTRSIMSYCRDWDQNGVWDNPPFTDLSNMDRLGIEMMYPKNYQRKPILGGFGNASGSQFIVRNDNNTSLQVDWVWLGGLTSAFSNVQWADGAGTVFATSTSASRKFTSTTTVKVQLDDAFKRHHSWTSTSAVPNNALHTAIAMSAGITI